jgi:hypothetical protein
MCRIRSRKIKIEWTTRENEGRGRRMLNRRMEEKNMTDNTKGRQKTNVAVEKERKLFPSPR